MNAIDALAFVLLVVTFLSGLRSGLLPQLGGLGGAILGGAVALLLLPQVRPAVADLDPGIRAFLVLAALLLLVAVGEAAGSALGMAFRNGLGGGVLSRLDSAGGAALGLFQGFLVIWLAGGVLAAGPLPSLASQAQRSFAVRTLNDVLPPPTEIAGELGHWLDASGLPEVFVGFEPFPAPPVDLPTDPIARAIAVAAIPSTVEVDGLACGFSLAGSGFVVAPGYVVTNAHVIAGTSSISVLPQSGSYRAVPVLFDASLDIALLYVRDLKAPPLTLATSDPERGTTGTALGHPGGGPLTVIPGAVSATYQATGRDLYGDRSVTRGIVELRAGILRGDSGGPFVLPDGTVGGVIFAQARTDATVGYALSPVDVAKAIQPAEGLTDAVATGPCIR